ncbi:hypothetical protein RERY_04310 [Rhodococcus erythropolis]|jgi:hypothetical protein|nr:hypothetical protein RERY_04310 [Rhodococcus erythropolis]
MVLEGRRGVDRKSVPCVDEKNRSYFGAIPPGRTMYWNLGLPGDALKEGPTKYTVVIDGKGPFGELDSSATSST